MDGRCRRHSEHRQSKGVCPSCLRDKLTHLSTSSSSATAATMASNESGNSPRSDASIKPRRADAPGVQSLKPPTLGKSRSLAFVFRKRKEEDKAHAWKQTARESDDGGKVEIKGENKKKQEKSANKKKSSGSFWSALISAGSERREQKADGGMLHSKTVKEKGADKWVTF